MGVFKIGEKWYIDYYYEGHRIKRAVGSKKDAENALAAVKADILRGEYRFKRKRRIWFEDFSEEFLEYSKVNKRSWTRDETSLKHLKLHFENFLLSRITPQHVEQYKRKRLEKVKISKVLNNILDIFRRNKLKVSSDFVLLAKAAVTVEGFATEYHPRLNFIENAKPFVRKIALERYKPKRIAAELRKKAVHLVDFAESIPRRATRLVAELEDTHKDLVGIIKVFVG